MPHMTTVSNEVSFAKEQSLMRKEEITRTNAGQKMGRFHINQKKETLLPSEVMK